MSFMNKKNDVTEEHIEKLLRLFKRISSNNVWSKVTKDDFKTERFEAGYINDICACTLTDDAQKRFTDNCEPIGIVVKIFSEIPFIKMNEIHKGIVCTMISTHKLGPELIYMDEECSINEYIQGSRHYELKDDEDEEFVHEVMRCLAKYNCMKVPVSVTYKEDWIDRFSQFLEDSPDSQKVWNGEYLKFFDKNPRLKDLRRTFEEMDWKIIYYFIGAQHKLNAPLVFSHLDFHRLNRLVREKTLPNGDKIKELYFIDLDQSLYFYRGYDLCSFFDSFNQTEPYFKRERFVSDEIICKYLHTYREECAKIIGKHYLDDESNSIERMLREIKFFALYYSLEMMFFSITMFLKDPEDEKNIEMIIGSHKRLVLFKQLKKRFEDEGILPEYSQDEVTKA